MNTPIANSSDSTAKSKRVLIVTINRNFPLVSPLANGMTIVADLTGAGYPFDVVSYDRFMAMHLDDSDDHDIIFLNGHASPLKVEEVALKCKTAIQSGRKIFINGHLPYYQYDQNGKQICKRIFSQELFKLESSMSWAHGKATIPESYQKDSKITCKGLLLKRINTFLSQNPPEIKLTLGPHIIGFLTSNGGAIDGSSDYFLNLLDYGKVTGYLRYGHPGIVGFANDRITGRPIVSIEVHCDITHNLLAITKLDGMANQFNIPLSNLLVWSRSTDDSNKRWNEVSRNPLMLIGSHSKTHPKFWPEVANFYDETTGALNEQRKSIPMTGHYFNFSGKMNPTVAQINQLFDSGTIFGAAGGEPRMLGLPFGKKQKHLKHKPIGNFIWRVTNRLFPAKKIQFFPTTERWFLALSQSSTTPFCLSYTIPMDFGAIRGNLNYCDLIKKSFYENIKFGLYTYGGIHDYAVNRQSKQHQSQGILLRDQIAEAFSFLASQRAIFIPTETLIKRLWDFVSGWIDYETKPDNSLQITVHRKSALANQIKIQSRNQQTPVAKGGCIVQQTLINNMLYVDLKPETKSTFMVKFEK